MKCYFCTQPITGPVERHPLLPTAYSLLPNSQSRFVAETKPFYGLGAPFQTPSAHVRQAWHEHVQAQTHKMTAGPFLDDDGHTLVVPSEWYHEDAARFWKSHGFEWRPKTATWQRDTRRPLRGKRYTPAAWLESTRRRFYRFWPTLLKPCRRCGHKFPPTSPYQIHCENCSP